MTMQNLDVYETFRERRVRCEFPGQFNNLGNRRPEKQRSLGAAQLARYSIDIVTRKPLLCDGPASSTTLLAPLQKRRRQ